MSLPRRTQSYTPLLRRHKAAGQAVVTLSGRDVYLGAWPAGVRKPPAQVREAYDRTIAEWLANGRRATSSQDTSTKLTVAELLLRFWPYCEQHYRRPDGTPTHEVSDYLYSLRPLNYLYGGLPAREFSPLKLKAVRQLMIDGYAHPRYGPQPALSRGVINHRVARIVRVYKWAVAEELVPADVHQALRCVRGLERGRTDARETAPVLPVALDLVEQTLPLLLPPVRAMIRLQVLTGARPGEACAMRGCDIDMTGPVWLYRPPAHKTGHRGKARVIALGPRAQDVVKPFLKLDAQAYLFSPREAMEQKRALLRHARRSKVQPSQLCRRRRKPKKQPGERYSTQSYGRAVATACKKAGLPHWHPHQLRHSYATEVRRRFGLEAAQVSLGHSQAQVSEIYAERDLRLAVRVAEEIG